MQLSSEQINTLINGGLIIISVIIGGIITVLGGIITNTFQKKQQEIKSRKDIFDERFLQVEKYMTELLNSCRNLNTALLQKKSQEQILEYLNKIMDVSNNSIIMASLRGTKDKQIYEEMQTFLGTLTGFTQNTLFYLMVHQEQSKETLQKHVLQISSLLEESGALLKGYIDDFKINDYRPIRKIKI